MVLLRQIVTNLVRFGGCRWLRVFFEVPLQLSKIADEYLK